MGSMPDYQKFIAIGRYARYLEEAKKRESWDQTVNRFMSFMKTSLKENQDYDIPDALYSEIQESIINLEVMPSMRCLMTAGAPLTRDNVCAYNCAYVAVDHPRAFDETLYILMCGTGVGFSVERQFINKLPEVSESIYPSDTTIVVPDSKLGWAKSFKELISMLYAGQEPKWDLSKLRPKGARLKTFGGRSSGPGPLDDLFRFTVNTFKGAKGRKLNSIECHDLMCKIGEVVVVGGVRRSAMLSLSNHSDDRLRHAKAGQWWIDNPQRALSNNSICYTEKPDEDAFMREWLALFESKSGERGIFNREASKKKVMENGRRDAEHDFGCNPCSEIILRSMQFCNLSEVVVRTGDTEEDLHRKVRLASILGTFQSTLTNFKYLRSTWAKNTEEERLLGVSLTGIMDNPMMFDGEVAGILKRLKENAVDTNADMAEKLGIPQSAAVTCVKPSGTVSQLVNSASGIHPRFALYYIRTVRQDLKDPLTAFMVEQGIPNEPAEGKENDTVVFSFPQKSPDVSAMRDDITAIAQLKLWLEYQRHWCEHKPSITVYVRDGEWMEVGAFVWEHFDEMSGVSFLPYDNGTYKQAPYQEITKEQYDEMVSAMPDGIVWDSFVEESDNTVSSQELACMGGSCEIP